MLLELIGRRLECRPSGIPTAENGSRRPECLLGDRNTLGSTDNTQWLEGQMPELKFRVGRAQLL